MPEETYLGTRSLEYALLGFLYEQPCNGYSLHQLVSTELGYIWHINRSQTHAMLKRLIQQGYISSNTDEQEKLSTTQLLQITKAARRKFRAWLEKPAGSSVHAIRVEFTTRLYFAEKLFTDMILKMLEAQSGEVDRALASLELDWAAIPPEQTFNRLSLDLHIRQLGSIHDWLIECHQAFEINI
jgi:DNA-binding PadR family transcriptional regulator